MSSNIYAAPVTIYSATPGAGLWLVDCQSTVNTGASVITLTVTVGGRTTYGGGVSYTKTAGITSVGYPVQVLAAAGEAVVITIASSNSSDTAVTLNTPVAVLQAVNSTQQGGTALTARDIGASVLLASSQHVIVDSGTVTTVTTLSNLPTAPNDWLTAAAVKADAVTKIQAGLSVLAAGAKMDFADSLNQTGVTDLKTKLGTLPATGDWSTTTALAAAKTILDKVDSVLEVIP